jgi:hypothetical protein
MKGERRLTAADRHAGMDCRNPGLHDASGDIHVNLGSGSPCRNDELAFSTPNC